MTAQALLKVELTATDDTTVVLGDVVAERPLLLVLLRHFG